MTNNGGSKRPKGYMDWKPREGSEAESVIHATRQILREYAGYGPMTVRQIFYRLVGQYNYDKTEKAYKRLAENLVKARRAQMISFNSIRDDGGTSAGGSSGYKDLDAFLDIMESYGDYYQIDKYQTQPNHIEMFCEAEGMVPMLGGFVRDFGVRITGTGGFSSLTVTHGIATSVRKRWEGDEKPTIFMHVGDFDPSGESIFLSMCQDIGGFVGGMLGGVYVFGDGRVTTKDDEPIFTPQRIALTAEQVDEYDLPTAPPKASDSRSANWVGETTQAEAMDPGLLQDVVTNAIGEYIDQEKVEELEEQEAEEREWLGPQITDAVAKIREEYEDR